MLTPIADAPTDDETIMKSLVLGLALAVGADAFVIASTVMGTIMPTRIVAESLAEHC
jgi:hypothetical protein